MSLIEHKDGGSLTEVYLTGVQWIEHALVDVHKIPECLTGYLRLLSRKNAEK